MSLRRIRPGLRGTEQAFADFLATISVLRPLAAGPDRRDRHPKAEDVCLEFGERCLRLTFDLELLVRLGTPPSPVGAVWTWPQAFRSLRSTTEGGQDIVVCLSRLAVVGPSALVAEAFVVANAVGELLLSAPLGRSRSKTRQPARMATFCENLEESRFVIQQFLAAVRQADFSPELG